MDVQLGHCWRCEKVLPEHTVPCARCQMAVYCSTSCRRRDFVRHCSVECNLFGPQRCNACGKTGVMRDCARCNYRSYCNKECQQRDWEAHKWECQQIKKYVKFMALKLCDRNSKSYKALDRTPPYYFGNTLAKDFLQLTSNEWSACATRDDKLRDYHILSAGCGDLRNTVLTAASLPDRYQGKLHITLNDFDPFVMARNVLFLFMMVRFADTDYIASSLTTIWYSLHLSKREYDLIKTSLDELIQMNAQQLQDATKGLVGVLDEDLQHLCWVWEGWRLLECKRDKTTSINLRRQRKALFETNNMNVYLNLLSNKDKEIMTEWFGHALFLPTEAKVGDLPFDNPTLTGKTERNLATKGCKFVYCIEPISLPFVAWDCLRVREHTSGSCSSPMVMYHNYVTNLLQKVKGLILQGRLCVHVSLANCLQFPNHHLSLQMPNFDRIFTSNLIDYVGVAALLKTFKPLLNDRNSFAVLVTESINWSEFIYAAQVEKLPDDRQYMCERAYFYDTHFVPETGININLTSEYYNNAFHFLLYLRADIMEGGLGQLALPNILSKKVPSLLSVMKYNGMQMRDFRKGLNKLIPFMHRLNARALNMTNGYDRAVEWCLPSQ